ncbi:hypothetical protein SUBVAR_07144 [Subdoligranulum variabile DSM 15176]|uniref:Uncharacterized protein n=1 Tax=Subdoligranulum variabile DSM 15176 TaxID=411471 RepID=D1PRW2_9FIRM|nr:hypothetical protein SUBVAR_07144 [Subdoligranulum variabile DSM 15176]
MPPVSFYCSAPRGLPQAESREFTVFLNCGTIQQKAVCTTKERPLCCN